MKKYLPLLAAALALTACSAAPASTPAPMQTPAAENAADEEGAAAFPIGELRAYNDWMPCTDTAYYTLYSQEDTTNIVGLKLDYANGVQTKVMSLDLANDASYSDWFVTNDNVARAFLANDDGSAFRFKSFYPDGRSEERTASQEITPVIYDEYAAYVLRDKYVARLDWQTGEVTTWSASIPQISEILGVAHNKVVLTRIVSDMPLPTDPEMSEAVLQSSLMEYDLYDVSSNTLEKLFDEPYYPEGGGSRKSYLGYRGDMLYFDQSRPDGDDITKVLWGYDCSAGTLQELYAEKSTGCMGGYSTPQGFTRSGQLEFLFLQSTSDTLHIYKTANGQVYKVPYHDPTLDAAYGNAENYGRPIALTGDGRVLVTDGYVQQDGSPADAYGLIDLDAYLSGSTDYTPVQMWQEQ